MLSFQYAFPKENVGIAPINTVFCKSFNESKPLKYREIQFNNTIVYQNISLI